MKGTDMGTAQTKDALDQLLHQFETGNIPRAAALSMFPQADIPSAKWSLCNRILMITVGKTSDARGFNQWKRAKRFVKKGTSAFHILGPRFGKKEENEDKAYFLTGFIAIPVFRVEDTDGEPLEYQELMPPTLPLKEVAECWGINICAIPGNLIYYGTYSPGDQQINLASPEELVFFHELAHAAYERVCVTSGTLLWEKEVIAELTAAVLCNMIGKTPATRTSYEYIEKCASKAQKTPIKACLHVLGVVEKCLNHILLYKETLEAAKV